MPNKFRRKKLSYLIHTALMSSLVAPVIAQAQDDEVEEIVVTGSYIRNSAFSQDTAADTVTGEDLLSSGTPNMSEYIRDLTMFRTSTLLTLCLVAKTAHKALTELVLTCVAWVKTPL